MKNHWNQSPMNLFDIRFRLLVHTNVQNFIGDTELFFILSIYPDYFFKHGNGADLGI